jgi:hypothetical protein
MRKKVASKSHSVINEHDAHAIAFDAVEQGREARPAFDRVRTAGGRIVEPLDNLKAGRLSKPAALQPAAMLIFSDADLNAIGAKTDATLDLYRKDTMLQRQRALTRLLDQRSNQQRLSACAG